MYQFALCDEDETERNKIHERLKFYGKNGSQPEFVVRHFSSVKSLLRRFEDGEAFDLLLMGLGLPGKSELEGARELRRMGCSSPFLFMANSAEHALEAFGMQPAHYLVKPMAQPDFCAAMDLVCGLLKEERSRYIAVKTDCGLRRIAVGDIVYCEAHKNYQYITLVDGCCLRLRMTSLELYHRLSVFPGFARCGVAYIVNLGHTVSVTAKELKLDNGSRILVPRGAFPAFSEQYFSFYGER